MNIAEKIFNHHLHRQTRNCKAFPVWSNVKHVLVVFDSDEDERNTQIMQLVKELRHAGKNVEAWGYCDKKDVLNPTIAGVRILSRADLRWFERLRKELVDDLQKANYDLLIDLSLRGMLPTRYISLWANAQFKAGRRVGKEPYVYNFMIELPADKDAAYLFDQIVYYLNNIESNDR